MAAKNPYDDFLKVFITQIHSSNAKPNSAKNQIDSVMIGFDRCQPSAPEGRNNGFPNASGRSGGMEILRLV
jgi:hypothetical protein